MKLIVDDLNDEKRLDLYLAEYFANLSRSRLQAEIKNGNVLVNSKTVKSSYLIKSGDSIDININDNNEIIIKPENILLDIVYEDTNMLVVNKPSGMLTHPTNLEQSGTLVNALLYKYGNDLSDLNGEFRRGILHRLDRNTSGLLMVVKNNDAHEFLVEKMKNREITKKYYAIVKGVIDEDEFTINEPIGRNIKYPQKMCVTPDGKESISEIKVLKRFSDATFIEVHLVTGRTHQIRVHLSYIGHPVYNDTLYGFGKMKIKTEEQVLQSYYLSFPKPFTNEMITVEIEKDDKIKKILAYYLNLVSKKS